MEHKTLGKTGIRISEIGLGTWKIPNNSKEGMDAIAYGIDNGIDFIDTAEMYGNEELVGRAIRGREVFLATKVSPSHFRYDDVIKACENSIKHLGVKAIDLYQLHWPNNRVPISETMKAMEKLQEDGKIQCIGVSNFTVDELVEAQSALSHNEIVSDQVEYSISVREPEDSLVEFCSKEGITLIAYSPLARGSIVNNPELGGRLAEVGKRYGKTPAQVALNYLLCSKSVVPIPKAIKKEHIAEDLEASGWRLSDKDFNTLKDIRGFRRKPLAGPMLKAFLKNTTIWARIMGRLEKSRKD